MADDSQDRSAEEIDGALDALAEFMEETLNVLDVGDDLEIDLRYEQGQIQGDLDGDEDDVALIIGKRGQTLDAIQYLANAVLSAGGNGGVGVQIDAQGYRKRRAKQLERVADRGVAEVARRGRQVALEPMTSSERKTIHMYLKDNDQVITESSGREPNRRLVLIPRND
jgi:spoIIIJ-associated protein